MSDGDGRARLLAEFVHASLVGLLIAFALTIASFWPIGARISQVCSDLALRIGVAMEGASRSRGGPDLVLLDVDYGLCDRVGAAAACLTPDAAPDAFLASILDNLRAALRIEDDEALAPAAVIFDLGCARRLHAASDDGTLAANPLWRAICAFGAPVIMDAGAAIRADGFAGSMFDAADDCPNLLLGGSHYFSDGALGDGVVRRAAGVAPASVGGAPAILADGALLAAILKQARRDGAPACEAALPRALSFDRPAPAVPACNAAGSEPARFALNLAAMRLGGSAAAGAPSGPENVSPPSPRLDLVPIDYSLPPQRQPVDDPMARMRVSVGQEVGRDLYVTYLLSELVRRDPAGGFALPLGAGAGAVIVVASSDPLAADWRTTPLGLMSGGEILVNAVQTYRSIADLDHVIASGKFSFLKLLKKFGVKIAYVLAVALTFSTLIVARHRLRRLLFRNAADNWLVTLPFGLITFSAIMVFTLVVVFGVIFVATSQFLGRPEYGDYVFPLTAIFVEAIVVKTQVHIHAVEHRITTGLAFAKNWLRATIRNS